VQQLGIETLMTTEQMANLGYFLVTVILAVAGFFLAKTIRTRRQNQAQRADRGSTAIQSGRDTKIQK
jgi:hypothetical protein